VPNSQTQGSVRACRLRIFERSSISFDEAQERQLQLASEHAWLLAAHTSVNGEAFRRRVITMRRL
jgi:hypothetical protein